MKKWRCFHCDDVFTNPKHAAAHFGYDELQTPGCVAVLRGGEAHLLNRILDLQTQLARFLSEDSDIDRWRYAKESRHQAALRCAEEDGYAKGLRDGLAAKEDANG